MLYWRSLKTSKWSHKLIRRLFTEVINQMRSGIIFSSAHNQSRLFATSGGKPCWSLERRHICMCTIFKPVCSVHLCITVCDNRVPNTSHERPVCIATKQINLYVVMCLTGSFDVGVFGSFYITWLVLDHNVLLLLETTGKLAFTSEVADGHPNKSVKESSLCQLDSYRISNFNPTVVFLTEMLEEVRCDKGGIFYPEEFFFSKQAWIKGLYSMLRWGCVCKQPQTQLIFLWSVSVSVQLLTTLHLMK